MPIPEDTELLMEFLDSSPVTAEEIRQWTDHDPVLSRVHRCITNDWPGSPDTRLHAYSLHKSELSVQDGVIFWGSRVIVPPTRKNESAGNASRSTPRNGASEGVCEELCLVAESGFRYQEYSSQLQFVSGKRKVSCIITDASLGMASETLGAHTH